MEGMTIDEPPTNYQEEENLISSFDVNNQWDKAALQWLDLICLHQVAVNNLSRKGRPGLTHVD